MPETSAGILLYRRSPALEVLIGHMGGPYWARKDAAAWSIPKGLYLPGEEQLQAALREFGEELGQPAPDARYELLGEFRQPSGKRLTVFIAEHDLAIDEVHSNTFELEWPPRSGKRQAFPEIDDARWVTHAEASEKLVAGQRPVLDALAERLDQPSSTRRPAP